MNCGLKLLQIALTGFGSAPAVRFRDTAGGAALLVCMACSLLHLLPNHEEVMLMLMTMTINLAKAVVPVVTFISWIAYLGYVIRLWVQGEGLAIHN